MRPLLLFSVCMAATSIAAPAVLNDAYRRSDEPAEFLSRVGRHINDITQVLEGPSTCDTSKITLPTSTSDMPSPNDYKPIYVALGRGTQVWVDLPQHNKE